MKKFNIKIGGVSYAVEVTGSDDNITNLTVNDIPYEVEEMATSGRTVQKSVHRPTVVKSSSAPTPAVTASTPVAQPTVSSGTATSGTGLKSPLPGVILELKVKEGDSVKMGQTVIILEAMKMENNVDADRDGIIEKINVTAGASVLEGDVLLTIK